MEPTNKTNDNCGCGDGCCTPKKSKPWTKILFFLIVAAAITIATYKIVAKETKPEVKAAVVSADSNAKKPSCCDTTQPNICTKVSDPNKPCCPQSKK